MHDTMLYLYIKMKILLMRDDGQDLVEYGLVVSLVFLGAVAFLRSLASQINTTFGSVTNTFIAAL